MTHIKQERIALDSITVNVATAGDPKNPPLFLLHGFPDDHATWKYQVDALTEAGYFLIMPDQRGINESDKPPLVSDYTLQKLRDDVIALAAHFGQKKFTIIGHGWGGILGWSFAEQQPEYLDKLIVLNAPSPSVLAHQSSHSIRQMLKFWYARLFLVPFVSTRLMYPFVVHSVRWQYPAHVDKAFVDRLLRNDVRVAAMKWYKNMSRLKDNRQKGSKFTTSALQIWGKKDTVLTKKTGILSAESADAQFVLLNKLTHWPHWDSPVLINQFILAFLSGDEQQVKTLENEGRNQGREHSLMRFKLLGMTTLLLIALLAFFALRPTDKVPATSSSDVIQSKPEQQEQLIAAVKTPQDPNVLLVILDDIGLDYFPGFMTEQGFDKARMPVIESLMQQSSIFHGLHTYAKCSPTRASLMTGMHGVETGVIDTGRLGYLDSQFSSVQQELKSLSDNQIATSVFGKWHLMGRDTPLTHPSEFGIDHYSGFIEGNHTDYSNWTKTVNGEQSTSTTYSTSEFTNDAIDWIAEQEGQWFSWLAYTAPHTPLHLPPADLHSYDDLSGSTQDLRRNGAEYYKAMLEAVDTEIGRLLDSMKQTVRDNTYVIVMGDNGTGGTTAQSPYKEVGVKGTLQTGGINTPMFVFNPALAQQKSHDQHVSTIDFFPTIVDMFGLQQQSQRSGKSFLPLATGEASSYAEHEYVYSQNAESVTVSTRSYKLIQQDSGADLFYDLANDPFEQNGLNISQLSTESQAAYDQLKLQLDSFLVGEY